VDGALILVHHSSFCHDHAEAENLFDKVNAIDPDLKVSFLPVLGSSNILKDTTESSTIG
jgi:hypothetical protein